MYERAEEVLRAAELWSDDRSRDEYERQIRWRALGEWTFTRPVAAERDSYFLPQLFSLRSAHSCPGFVPQTA